MTDRKCPTVCYYDVNSLDQVKYFVLKEAISVSRIDGIRLWWIWLCDKKRKIKVGTCPFHSEIIEQVASNDKQEDLLEQEKTDEYFRRGNRQVVGSAAFASDQSGRRIVWSKERDGKKMVPGWSTRRI